MKKLLRQEMYSFRTRSVKMGKAKNYNQVLKTGGKSKPKGSGRKGLKEMGKGEWGRCDKTDFLTKKRKSFNSKRNNHKPGNFSKLYHYVILYDKLENDNSS
ncbi:unnamed protein product [Rangifer tarandus platyrhynchus]|uniref:Uncharacterized protein n=1 Tax=Rangifer tarandus platyrhynchus TaxID=3082113 RepID=A0ABN8ZR23_RANTA|nr:unnamed protein product [Rangifer tarandus platyrhynchus]